MKTTTPRAEYTKHNRAERTQIRRLAHAEVHLQNILDVFELGAVEDALNLLPADQHDAISADLTQAETLLKRALLRVRSHLNERGAIPVEPSQGSL